jgi:anti-sigma-K factor RskA
MYADGELTAEEGKKAEELQKKIQDFTTLIKDYEDSLNQLMTSIETFENTLYELFSN